VGETIDTGGGNARTAVIRPGQEAGENWLGYWWILGLLAGVAFTTLGWMLFAALAGQSHPFIWSQASGLIALPDPLITAEG